MMELKITGKFRKDYKRCKKRGLDMSLLEDVIDTLLAGKPLEEKYRDHGLVGRYAGHRECHILPDWLLIYLSGEDPRFYKRGTANILLVSVAGYNPPLR